MVFPKTRTFARALTVRKDPHPLDCSALLIVEGLMTAHERPMHEIDVSSGRADQCFKQTSSMKVDA